MENDSSLTRCIRPFPGEESYTRAFQIWIGQIEDCAAAFTTASHPQHGLLWLVLTPADWLLLGGVNGPHAALAHPGARPAQAAQAAAYDRDLAEFKAEVKAINTLRQGILASLDQVATQVAQEDDPMRNLEVPTIVHRLRVAWGIPSVVDLNTAIGDCRREFVPPDPMDAFFARQTANYRLLAQARQAVPDAVKIANAVEALTPCAIYTECIRTFEQKFGPGDPARTFAAFRAAILAFDRLTPKRTTGSMGYAAAATRAPSAPAPSTPDPALEARVRRLEEGAGLGDSGSLDISQRILILERVAAGATVTLRYCWSHGFNHSHDSAGCQHPKEGHKRNATADKKLGGSTKTVTRK